MDTPTLLALLLACAPRIDATTALALIKVESALNPFAIGIVGATLTRQPHSFAEAVTVAQALAAQGWNFSVGLAQINVRNWPSRGLTTVSAFDPCSNLASMQSILTDCFERAQQASASEQHNLRKSLSCYYAGNFSDGIRQGYVRRVAVQAAALPIRLNASTVMESP